MRIDLGVIFARNNLRQHARGPLGGLALVLLCCTVYLPGFFSIPPVDRDESRFAQASRQMFESVALPEGQRDAELHSGGLAVPMVGGKPRLNKPPMIYWLQAGSAAVFTSGDPLADAIWMYRVPSLVAGLVIVLATWRLGCSMFDPRAGWVAGALLAVSPVFVWEAHQARADMVMVAWTTLAMGRLWRIWQGSPGSPRSGPLSRPRRERAGERAPSSPSSTPSLSSIRLPSSLRLSVTSSLLLWLFTALGILTKGPITPMVVLLTALTLAVLSRRRSSTAGGRAFQPAGGKHPGPGGRAFQPAGLRWLLSLHPLLGLLIAAAAVAPWVYAVAQQVGFASYWQIVSDEVFARAGSAKEGHWGPPGYHLVLLVVLFWPGSLLTGLSIGRAWRRGLRVGATHGGGGGGDRAGSAPPSLRGSAPSSLRRSVASSLQTLRSLRVTRRPEAFLLAWMLPSWLVFELVGTKLPHYTMPLYPAVALITARGLFAAMSGTLVPRQGWRRFWGSYIWLMVGAAWGIVVPVAIGLGGALTTPSSLVGTIAAALVVLVSLGVLPITWKALRAGELWRAQAVATVWAVFVLAGLLGLALPNARSLWVTERLNELSHRASHDGLAREVVFVDHKEDSLVFASRGRPRIRMADDLARELVDRAGDLAAWVSSSRVSSLRDEVQEHSSAARPVHLESLTFFSGFNYAKGKLDTWELVTVETDNSRGRND